MHRKTRPLLPALLIVSLVAARPAHSGAAGSLPGIDENVIDLSKPPRMAMEAEQIPDEVVIKSRKRSICADPGALGIGEGGLAAGSELGTAGNMFEQKQYEDSRAIYSKVVARHPKTRRASLALYCAGLCHYHMRYYNEAVETWIKLRDLYPKAPEAVKAEYRIGDVLFRAQKYAKAIRQYRRVLKKYPKSDGLALALLRIAQSRYHLKDNPGALNGALAMVSRFPDASEAVDALDIMEAVFDRAPRADFRKSLSAVIDAVPDADLAAEARFRIGRRLSNAKRYAEAAAEFQAFTADYTWSPKLVKVQFLWGEALLHAKEHAKAAVVLERYLASAGGAPDVPAALLRLAHAYSGGARHKLAIKAYHRLLEEFPQSEHAGPAQSGLAEAHKAGGNLHAAAESYWRIGMTLGADDAARRKALWHAYAIHKDLGNFPQALTSLELIARGASIRERFETACKRGEVLLLMDRAYEAKKVLEGLVRMKPKGNKWRISGLTKLGELFETEQQFMSAAEIYDDVARNARSGTMKAAARKRAAALRKRIKPASRKGRGRKNAGRKTQVMPKSR